jgi:purine-nucleoside phosphorylase
MTDPLAALAEIAPQVAVVLGSGLGPAAGRLALRHRVAFADMPGIAVPSAPGHKGRISAGHWAGQRVLVFEGRLHFYEGHPWPHVVVPVQTAASLGVRTLLLTNAAGGIHADLGPGCFLAVRDHIEWTRPYSWRHPGPGGLGGSRPSPYAAPLRAVLREAAAAVGVPLREGVYAAVTGPNYETPAEIRALRAWGADAVGMSTAREAQAAADAGLACAALSCITNRAAGLQAGPLNAQEVLATAAAQCERLADLIEAFLRRL